MLTLRDPWRTRVLWLSIAGNLFAAALMHEWPVASAGAFTAMPLSGWFFVLLGLGLAETRAYITAKP